MLIRNTKKVSVDEVQGYLTKGARVHPLLYASYLKELVHLEHARKLCLTPRARMELYSNRVSTSIARKLAM